MYSYQTKIKRIQHHDKCTLRSWFLLTILLQYISKDNTASCLLTSFVFIMSPVVSELALHVICTFF